MTIINNKNQCYPIAIVLMAVTVLIMPWSSIHAGSKEPAPLHQPQFANHTDRLIIKWRSDKRVSTRIRTLTIQQRVNGLDVRAGVVGLKHKKLMSTGAHIVDLPNRMTLAEAAIIANRLKNDPDIEYAEPDYIMWPMAVPNDTYYSSQWHYDAATTEAGASNLPAAWDITTGDASIVVAVIDTGILPHSDLSGRTLPGYDFIADIPTANDGDGRDSDPTDPGDWITSGESSGVEAGGLYAGCLQVNSSWHGTHVAGTIGAVTNNNAGVAGVNWVSKILPVRVLGKCGGYSSDIIDGMRWAAGLSVSGVPVNANPADVLNVSLGGIFSCSASYQNAIDEIVAAGKVVVVAAGNELMDAANLTPASCNNVITVAANNRAGGRAWYSNFGTVVEVTAPGGDGTDGIASTLDSGLTTPLNDNIYVNYMGTSMATPHVAGIVSLMQSANYALTSSVLSHTIILQKIQATARTFPTGTGLDCTPSTCGSGLIDAALAVRAVSTAPTADAGTNQSVNTNDLVSLDGSASSDDGSIAGYAWTQTVGTNVTLNNANTATPSFTTPNASGVLTFQLTVIDDVGITDTVTVDINVNAINNAPIAYNFVLMTNEDTVNSGTLIGSDLDGDSLIFSIVANGSKGTAVITDTVTGAFTYTPNGDAFGSDTFTFKVNDSKVDSNPATISISITAVNDVPVTNAGTLSVTEDISITGVLSASDADGDSLTYSLTTYASKGDVVITNSATGAYTYLPDANANGVDSFDFIVNDGLIDSSTATVTINFIAVNDVPSFQQSSINGLIMSINTTATISFAVDDPDIDTNNDTHTFSVSSPLLGTAVFSANALSYTATQNGSEILTITVTDSLGLTDTLSFPVSVNVAGVTDSNNDGITDTQASNYGIDPNDTDGDTDNDGILDILEIGTISSPIDNDNDGIDDVLEVGVDAFDNNVLHFVIPASTAQTLGVQDLAEQAIYMTASSSHILLANSNNDYKLPLYSEASLTAEDADYNFPFGVLDFSVASVSTSTVVTIDLPSNIIIPNNAVIRKMGNSGAWITFSNGSIDFVNRRMTLNLTDNDSFDLNPTVGTIRYPVGIGVPETQVSATSNNTSNSSSSGGGGSMDPWIIVWGIMMLFYSRRRSI